MYDLMKSYEVDFDSAEEFNEAFAYVESFFDIIEDDNEFKKNVLDAARTK
jgi:hypothetical protein